MKDLPFSVKRSDTAIRQAFLDIEHQAVWAAFDGKEMCGVLIGAICAYPFFDACFATDHVFVADKEGDKLFRSFSQWAKSHGASAMQMGVTSGFPQAERFYEAMGFERVGGIYFKPLSQTS